MNQQSLINFPNGLPNNGLPLPVGIVSGNISVSSGNISLYTASGAVSQGNPLPVDIGGGTVNINVNSGTNLNVSVTSGQFAILSGRVSVSSGNTSIYTASGAVSQLNPFPVSISSGAFSNNTIPVSFAAGTTDAFGRLRVSNPFTVFDSQHRYQINDKWNYVTSGGGSTVYDINGSLVNLNTNLASGSQVIAETKRVMPYQPGKSLLIYSTFTMSSVQESLRQRIGYFGEQNGIYFELDGESVNFVKRSYVSGSVVETKATRNGISDWNIDNLDGTGPSGYNLSNYSSSLILYIEIEWLGVGDVRVGFLLNGTYVPCHSFKHTPVGGSPISGTYMTTACLPLRAEITNKGPIANSGNLKQICNSVISEGGYEGFSRRYDVSLGTNPKNLTNADELYPIISMRLASGRLDSIIIPSNLNAIVTSNQDIQYRILLNATLSGPSWQTHYNGNVQYDTSATSLTSGSGTDVIGGYLNKQGNLDVASINQFNFQIGRLLNGTSETLTVAFAPTSANTKVLADLAWFEIV
jgi:hypothetical protein